MESQKTEHNTIEKENNAEKIYKIIEELVNYKNLLSEYDLKNDYEKYANLKTKYEAKKDEFLEMIKNTDKGAKIVAFLQSPAFIINVTENIRQ